MVFILFFLSSRLFLSNKVVTNLTINNKISKKIEGSWYYVKCQKNRNCTDVIYTIKKRYNITDISVINKNAFTIYFSRENSKILQLLNLKYMKIPKNDKIIQRHTISTQHSNNYIIYLSKSCRIPYNTTKVASNYLIFQSNETFDTISQKLSKIGCVRLLEQLPYPRLNTYNKNQKKNSKQRTKTQIVDDTLTNSVNEDPFSLYNNFKTEDDTNDLFNTEFTRKITEGNIFSLHMSQSHHNLLQHGINGKGQVASIVDTGLDPNLCWFVDPEREVEFGKEVPSEHRKIQSYFTYADDNDISPGGHGSFVSGLIAGSALCDLYVNDKCTGSYFNGVAPNAKLVINDVFTIKKHKIWKRILESGKQSKEDESNEYNGENNENDFKLINKKQKNKNTIKPSDIKNFKNIDIPNEKQTNNQNNDAKFLDLKNINDKGNDAKFLDLKAINDKDNDAEVLDLKNINDKGNDADVLDDKNNAEVDKVDDSDEHKEENEYKKKVRDERKMRSRFKRKGRIENPVHENDENENEIIYYNPYDTTNHEQIIASFPENLSKLFILPSKSLGATVQYHGFDFRDKSLFTSLIDMFAYENPTMTLVFPSGDLQGHERKIKNKVNGYSSLDNAAVSSMTKNAGFSYDKTIFTKSKVSSPGDSKNVLTVGATEIDPIVSINEFKMNSQTSPIVVVVNNVEYLGYCDEFAGISFFDYIINSMKLKSKQNFVNDSYSFVIGDHVFIETEKLDAFTFIQSPKFESTEILILFKPNGLPSKIDKPVIRLPEEYQKNFVNGNQIQIRFFNDLNSLHLINSINSKLNAKYSRINPHYFRRKPDIFLQGGPVYGPNSGSLKSSPHYCGIDGLRIGEGTSVAAAFATGEILLIQQYIKEGFYMKKEMETMSHTIRAILSNIAINDQDDENNDKRVPDLDKFCLFKDSYNMEKNGGIRFFSDFLLSNSFHVYKFKAQFKGDLKVTIAWNDPPHDPFAPSDVLFKVDCRIESIKDRKLIGDVHYDPLNTVKNYVIKDVNQNDEFKIFVLCGDLLFFEKLNYTIVISGPFDHFSSENEFVSKIEDDKNKGELKCLHQCKDKSKCVNGYCQCAKKKYGEDCSKDMIEMHNHKTLSGIYLLPHDSVFMSYVFKQWKPGSKLSFTFTIKKSNLKVNQKKRNDESIKIDEVHHVDKLNENKKIENNNLNDDISEDDIDLNDKLFFMFSINKVPTWQSANCDSENCQWVSIEGNSLVIEYHLWNFVRNGDTLYLVVYSRENYPISFSVSSSELYN